MKSVSECAKILISIVLIGILIILIVKYRHLFCTENYDEILIEFPFKKVVDQHNKPLDLVAISAPFREAKHEQTYEKLKKAGKTFIGVSSYLSFPNKITNPFEDRFHEQQKHNYPDMCKAWLHCFRNPTDTEKFKHLPHMLITEADLIDLGPTPEPVQKEYDFMYVCLKDNDKCVPGWQSFNRNWELAKVCLEIMCAKYKLRGIMVGRTGCDYSEKCNGIVKVHDFLPYHEFQAEMKKSRFLFVPNVTDASPRVITEAMKYNIPVLCNYNIIGGWHNIVSMVTGEFFWDPTSFALMLPKFLQRLDAGVYHPRQWLEQHRGKKNSGKQLCEFLRKCFPDKIGPQVESVFIY